MSQLPTSRVVLAVDDEPLVLDLIEAALLDGGFDVRTAATSQDAMAILEAERARDIGALVTDVNMPGLDGWELAQRARELNPALPVVYVSGDSAHEWSSRGVPNSQVLQKPFAAAQLVAAVANLMNAAPPAPETPGD